jgi:magnesium transporter
VQQTIISYNELEIKKDGSMEDIQKGFKIWIDIIDPTPQELAGIKKAFQLDTKAFNAFMNNSKKPQVRVLDNHTFTIILDIEYKERKNLAIEVIYLFLGTNWLITIHSPIVDLMATVNRILEEKNKKITAANIDALYYSILSETVDRYEKLLTSIELTLTNIQQRSLYKPTKKMLEYLDSLSIQIILLRRHFWNVKSILNFLSHTKKDNDEVEYIEVAYDNITQLIDLVESYRDSINSTRDLYIANVSLQMNDTMKTLTLFSAILLPLTFIASVYGMNGLDLNNINSIPVGFAIVLITMGVVGAFLFWLFKKKQWILVKEDDGNNTGKRQKE